MPRRVQDIVPSDRRSIRNIPISIPIHKKREEPEPKRMSFTPPPPKRKKSKRGLAFIAVCGVVIVLVATGFVLSSAFAKATFTITPKTVPVAINSTYVAQSSPTAGALTYELVAVNGVASTTVSSTDGPKISEKATGKVTVYNAYSATSAKLIAGTRFSDDTGRIYRLNSTIIIPGYSKTASGIIAGSITATVVADEAGQSYNIYKTDSISDFKVVAYKGSPKYDTIYARISGDIIGGFVGAKQIVDPKAVASSTATLKTNMTAKLLGQIKNSIPEGYTIYDSGYVSSFSSPTVGASGTNTSLVTIHGTLYGIMFKTTDLVNKLAGDATVKSFGIFGYVPKDLDTLDFSIANAKDFSPEKKNALLIKLKGNLELQGKVPVEELKKKLAGASLADTQSIIKPYYNPVIESGSGELSPPWAKVPKDLSRITVVINEK